MRKIYRFILGMMLLLVIYTMIFMVIMRQENQMDNVDPITGVYWVIVTMTTVGYGEVIFNSPLGRMFSALVALSGIFVLFANALPIVITPWFDRLSRELPTRIPHKLSDHIIICGYNPHVETLIDKLSSLNIPFLVIERREGVATEIYQRYPTIWGDPAERQTLLNAAIHQAKVLIANENEEINANLILAVREISDVEIIALVEDLSKSRFLSYAGASRVISPKTLLGTFLAQIASPPREGVFPGALHLFGGLKLVELPIYPGSDLIGRPLSDQSVVDSGASVVGIWQRGRFISLPGPEERVQSNTVVLAVGEVDQLSGLRKLTHGDRLTGQFLVVGYGDVGRRVVKVLCDWGINPVVVDRRELEEVEFESVVGDGASVEVLEEAGVKRSVGVLIMLNRDSDVIYSTLIARNLNPKAFIIARANHLRSAEKIYKAGADYVFSVPLLASHMLFKLTQAQGEELTVLYEGLELSKYTVPKRSGLAYKTVGELDLHKRFGCTAVAVDRDGVAICRVSPETVIRPGNVVALIGSSSGIEAFGRAYKTKLRIPGRG